MTVPKLISISNNTPITLAMAILIGTSSFYVGTAVADHSARLNVVERDIATADAEARAWRADITKLLTKMTEVSHDNKRRLDIQDAINSRTDR